MENSPGQLNEIIGRPLPCPLCGQDIPVKMSKSGKPYIICDDCGVQLFIRSPRGIERLRQIIQEAY